MMDTLAARQLQVIDSHTEGEPTRVLVSGGPDIDGLGWPERSQFLTHEGDWIRSTICNEPRGHEAMVGALLCQPHDPSCVAGVVFFNNVGLLNMCIHAAIGVTITLAHLDRISPGRHRLETRVGVVTVELHGDGRVTVENVPSYLLREGVAIDVPGYGQVIGDIAWGGNWFFLIEGYGPEVAFSQIEELTHFCWEVRKTLAARGICGRDGMEIDHVECFGPPDTHNADSKNFVLCPGKAYDRSPCGTGTSAKLASLFQKGLLKEWQLWRQAGILNTVFEGFVKCQDEKIIPVVSGSAWVNAESRFLLDPGDPFCEGIRLKRPHLETDL